MNNIITTLISTIAGIITAYIAIVPKLKQMQIDDIKREQKQSDDMVYFREELGEVKKRLDIHNHYAEKFDDIKVSVIKVENEISNTQKDIELLRKEFSNVTCKRK